jgi:hypothetical protein
MVSRMNRDITAVMCGCRLPGAVTAAPRISIWKKRGVTRLRAAYPAMTAPVICAVRFGPPVFQTPTANAATRRLYAKLTASMHGRVGAPVASNSL